MNNARKGDEHESLLTATIVSKLLVFRAPQPLVGYGEMYGRREGEEIEEERKDFPTSINKKSSIQKVIH